MLRFKDYLSFRHTKEGYIILDEPIHFKNQLPTYRKTKEGYIILDGSIRFINKQDVKESESADDDVKTAAAYNQNHHGFLYELSDKLHGATAMKLGTDWKHMRKFTSHDDNINRTGSYSLNNKLVEGQPLTGSDRHMHDAIMKHAKPSGYEFHVFSGTSRDFEAISKNSKDRVIHMPAHTSTTHSLPIAREFACTKFDTPQRGDYPHLIHIHVKPHDKVLHVSKYAPKEFSKEHETIIPAGTKLKYSHSSNHSDGLDKYRVHHFTIHSQE